MHTHSTTDLEEAIRWFNGELHRLARKFDYPRIAAAGFPPVEAGEDAWKRAIYESEDEDHQHELLNRLEAREKREATGKATCDACGDEVPLREIVEEDEERDWRSCFDCAFESWRDWWEER